MSWVKQNLCPFVYFAMILLLSEVMPWSVTAQVLIPPEPGNKVSVTANADVTFNASAGLYTYSYKVTNSPTSLQEVWFFALKFPGDIIAVTSPSGWSFSAHEDQMIVSWGATELGPLAANFVDDGNVLPSPFQIKPGQILTGFSFQSPDPPGTVRFFAQGFTKLPQVASDVGDLPQEGEEIPDFMADSMAGQTSGPVSIAGQPFPGGRRPAVDGFLGFVNITNNDTRTAPVAIIVKFSLNGETVNPATFRATLNRVDVTSSFVPGGAQGDLVGVFDLGSSPLQGGRNVLLTTITGIVPGSNRTASDVDRVTFFIQ